MRSQHEPAEEGASKSGARQSRSRPGLGARIPTGWATPSSRHLPRDPFPADSQRSQREPSQEDATKEIVSPAGSVRVRFWKPTGLPFIAEPVRFANPARAAPKKPAQRRGTRRRRSASWLRRFRRRGGNAPFCDSLVFVSVMLLYRRNVLALCRFPGWFISADSRFC